jgi:hypothetical protein
MSEEIPVHPVQVAPVPRTGAMCPQVVTLRAYEVYCEVFSPQPALVEGRCRGGFSTGELIAFLYAHSFPITEWKARVNEALKGMQAL